MMQARASPTPTAKAVPGYLQEQSDYVTVPAAAAALSQFRFVRVDTKIHLKSLIFESEAQGAGKVQLGLYYADNDNDIAPGNSANKSAVVSGCVDLFSGDIDCASAVLRHGQEPDDGGQEEYAALAGRWSCDRSGWEVRHRCHCPHYGRDNWHRQDGRSRQFRHAITKFG
jgi:hypothetical protein